MRIEARTGEEIICLNPIIRYEGSQLIRNNVFPDVNMKLTTLSRILVFIISIFNLIGILLFNKEFRGAIHKTALKISAWIHGFKLRIESMFKPSIS